MNIWEFIFRLGAAVILGALIGFERQWRQKSANENDSTSISVITAEILAEGRQDQKIEKVAGMLTKEKGVTEVSWEIGGVEIDI